MAGLGRAGGDPRRHPVPYRRARPMHPSAIAALEEEPRWVLIPTEVQGSTSLLVRVDDAKAVLDEEPDPIDGQDRGVLGL